MIKKEKIELLKASLNEGLYIHIMFENFNGFNKFNSFKMNDKNIVIQVDDGKNDNWSLDNFIKYFFNQYKNTNAIVYKSFNDKINHSNKLFNIK